MFPAHDLAYLGGLVDGDGYFKITRSYRTPSIRHPYYANVIGVSQLWPGPAVHLFAGAFGGDVKAVTTQHGTWMARCELRTGRAESAARRLLPFLLVKRTQALLFLEVPRVRPKRHGRTLPSEHGHEDLERITNALTQLQQGRWGAAEQLPLSSYMTGYEGLSPGQLGWTEEETLAYLAGTLDSDGNFRILKKRGQRMRWPYYQINVRCAQVLPSPAVELLCQTFGGRVSTKRERRANHRDLAMWSINDRTAFDAVTALLPHLRVKSADASLLLKLRELKSRGKEDLTECRHRTRWQRVIPMRKRSYSEEQVAEFDQVKEALQALHRCRTSPEITVPAGRG